MRLNILGTYLSLSKSFSPSTIEHTFKLLEEVREWEQVTYNFSGKEVKAPRLIKWYGSKSYEYSGHTHEPQKVPPYLDAHKTIIQEILEERDVYQTFNSLLVNKYRDERDSVAWHADDEPELRGYIASVSLGAPRTFSIKPKKSSPLFGRISKLDLRLEHGDLLIMNEEFQEHWLHCVRKERDSRGVRYNLTYRTIV